MDAQNDRHPGHAAGIPADDDLFAAFGSETNRRPRLAPGGEPPDSIPRISPCGIMKTRFLCLSARSRVRQFQ